MPTLVPAAFRGGRPPLQPPPAAHCIFLTTNSAADGPATRVSGKSGPFLRTGSIASPFTSLNAGPRRSSLWQEIMDVPAAKMKPLASDFSHQHKALGHLLCPCCGFAGGCQTPVPLWALILGGCLHQGRKPPARAPCGGTAGPSVLALQNVVSELGLQRTRRFRLESF